jgi:hypothetical protein
MPALQRGPTWCLTRYLTLCASGSSKSSMPTCWKRTGGRRRSSRDALDQAWRRAAQALVDRAIQTASQGGVGALGWVNCSRAWCNTASSISFRGQAHSLHRLAAAAHQRSVGRSLGWHARRTRHRTRGRAGCPCHRRIPPHRATPPGRWSRRDPAVLGRQNMTNSQPSPINGPLPRGKRHAPGQEAAAPATATVRAPAPVHPIPDIVDEWGRQSFPASDPPSNW